MQSFSRSEILWIAKELSETSSRMEALSAMEAATAAERELYRLRAEQFKSIAEKLRTAAGNGDRRIEIRNT